MNLMPRLNHSRGSRINHPRNFFIARSWSRRARFRKTVIAIAINRNFVLFVMGAPKPSKHSKENNNANASQSQTPERELPFLFLEKRKSIFLLVGKENAMEVELYKGGSKSKVYFSRSYRIVCGRKSSIQLLVLQQTTLSKCSGYLVLFVARFCVLRLP
jgi:hypothetical protein